MPETPEQLAKSDPNWLRRTLLDARASLFLAGVAVGRDPVTGQSLKLGRHFGQELIDFEEMQRQFDQAQIAVPVWRCKLLEIRQKADDIIKLAENPQSNSEDLRYLLMHLAADTAICATLLIKQPKIPAINQEKD